MSQRYPKISLRIDLANGERLGPGKVALLKAIAEVGSISAAAKLLGMSYPRAWKLVGNMNMSFERPLVESFQGGVSRGGAILTDTGLQIISLYELMHSNAEAANKETGVLLASLQSKKPQISP